MARVDLNVDKKLQRCDYDDMFLGCVLYKMYYGITLRLSYEIF